MFKNEILYIGHLAGSFFLAMADVKLTPSHHNNWFHLCDLQSFRGRRNILEITTHLLVHFYCCWAFPNNKANENIYILYLDQNARGTLCVTRESTFCVCPILWRIMKQISIWFIITNKNIYWLIHVKKGEHFWLAFINIMLIIVPP